MNLHNDQEAFSELLQATAESIGLPQVYVEKDYWVTKALKHLAQSPHASSVVFKGGTSLSKAYRLIDRFSEDIDLAICFNDTTDNQRKKLIKDIENAASEGLRYIENDDRESKGSRFRRTVYEYPRLTDELSFGQASPQLLIEVNTFTKPEPFEKRELQSLVADFLITADQTTIIAQYELESFSINVLSVKRTLIEKILGVIKDSYSDQPVAKLSARIRHLYDICLILRSDEHRSFFTTAECTKLFKDCIEDEVKSFGDPHKYFERKLIEAPIFTNFEKWRPSIEVTYSTTFSDLVYGDLPLMNEIELTVIFIKGVPEHFRQMLHRLPVSQS